MVQYEHTFKHSGKLGDLIYALPTIRALGGGILHLAENAELGFGPSQIKAILPLLKIQPYIRGIKIWNGKPVDFDLDLFRTGNTDRTNLAELTLAQFGMPSTEKDCKWLELEAAPQDVPDRIAPSIVFARSLHNPGFPGFWPAIMDRYGGEAMFVGTCQEYECFAEQFGYVPYRQTQDLLELAVELSQAKLFVGNQSCPYAVAEGLQIDTIQETHNWSPNCIFDRPNAFYVSNQRHLAKIENGDELPGNAREVALAAKPKVRLGPQAGELQPASLEGASIVVLTYNSMQTIEDCLASIWKTIGPQDELILVDNASKDGTADFLRALAGRPNTTVILNDGNKGFSTGCNQGIQISKGRFVVLLNPDTVVTQDWIPKLASRFENPAIGAIGPVSDNVLALQFVEFHLPNGYCGGGLPEHLARSVAAEHSGHSIETKLLVGFCLMFRREALNQAGLLNESMFLGSEDLEISWRLRELGYKLLIARDVFVSHRCGRSFASLGEGEKERILDASTDALVACIQDAYAPQIPPASTELWGIDIVPDDRMLKGLKGQKMKKKAVTKKPSPLRGPKPARQACVQPGFHEMWYSEDSLLALEALGHKVKELNGAVIELGCWEGAGACTLANAVNPEIVYAVDTWRGNLDEAEDHETVRILKPRNVKATFEANVMLMTAGNVKAVQQDCHEFMCLFTKPVKLCHIDACHDYESVRRSIAALLPKVVQGGILCGDDIMSAHAGRQDLQGGVERAVTELLPGYFRRGNFWYWIKPATLGRKPSDKNKPAPLSSEPALGLSGREVGERREPGEGDIP